MWAAMLCDVVAEGSPWHLHQAKQRRSDCSQIHPVLQYMLYQGCECTVQLGPWAIPQRQCGTKCIYAWGGDGLLLWWQAGPQPAQFWVMDSMSDRTVITLLQSQQAQDRPGDPPPFVCGECGHGGRIIPHLTMAIPWSLTAVSRQLHAPGHSRPIVVHLGLV